jgi:drug/metabolite transporter (DMT)-like permease
MQRSASSRCHNRSIVSPATRQRAWFAWSLVCVIWGTTYLAIKIALESIPPFLMGGIRYVIAGAILAAWLMATGRPLPLKGARGRLVVLGFFMLTLGNGGVVWGEQYLSSGLTAVIIATTPFWMVGVDAALGGDRLHLRQVIGLAVGLAGIVILVWPDLALGGNTRQVLWGILALQIACCGWAIASSSTRRHVVSADVLGAAALQMMFGGGFLVLLGVLVGEWQTLSFTPRTTTALVYLILAGSLVAFAAYSYALRHLPVAVVSLYTYINPVIAVALGTLLLGEPFHLSMVVGGAVIAMGILIVRPRASRRTSSELSGVAAAPTRGR